MSNARRNAARDRLKPNEEAPFEKVDAIRALQDVVGCYLNPHPFKPGDLIQTRNHYREWAGAGPSDPAPLMVLSTCENLGAILDDGERLGVVGIRVAMADADEGIALVWEEAWHFEPYSGPMPDAH